MFLRIGFLSFLVGFIFVGAACSSKPAAPSQPTATPVSMSQPEESKANEDVPLSSGTDVDSLQQDLDNTDLSGVDSAGNQMQTELSQ